MVGKSILLGSLTSNQKMMYVFMSIISCPNILHSPSILKKKRIKALYRRYAIDQLHTVHWNWLFIREKGRNWIISVHIYIYAQRDCKLIYSQSSEAALPFPSKQHVAFWLSYICISYKIMFCPYIIHFQAALINEACGFQVCL